MVERHIDECVCVVVKAAMFFWAAGGVGRRMRARIASLVELGLVGEFGGGWGHGVYGWRASPPESSSLRYHGPLMATTTLEMVKSGAKVLWEKSKYMDGLGNKELRRIQHSS